MLYDSLMSDPCDDAKKELSTAENRLESEEYALEECYGAVRAAERAHEAAYYELRQALGGASGWAADVAKAKDVAREAGRALIDAEANYHEINRDARLGQLAKELRDAEYEVERAERGAEKAQSAVAACERGVSSAQESIDAAQVKVAAAKGEVGKAEAWVTSARQKVSNACG